jgi:hypothetical protein
MHWYARSNPFRKLASVTFYVGDGAQKIAQPQTILDLCHDLSKHFYYGTKIEHGAMPLMNDIAPDGYGFDQFEGTMNVYPNTRDMPPENASDELAREWWTLSEEEKSRHGGRKIDNSLEAMMPVIDEWIGLKEAEGYVIEKRMDTSNMTNGPVLRIEIKENASKEYEQIPEVNMNNENAAAVIRSMGLLPEPSGTIDVDTLLYMINSVEQQDMIRHTKEDKVHYDEEGNPNMFEYGRDENYIDMRIQQLYGLADYAKRNGFTEIFWG